MSATTCQAASTNAAWKTPANLKKAYAIGGALGATQDTIERLLKLANNLIEFILMLYKWYKRQKRI